MEGVRVSAGERVRRYANTLKGVIAPADYDALLAVNRDLWPNCPADQIRGTIDEAIKQMRSSLNGSFYGISQPRKAQLEEVIETLQELARMYQKK